MDPIVALVRRWAVDWLGARRPEVCPEILAPGYTLMIGGFRLGERDNYIEATLGQLDRFPGLGVTVHELITTGDRVALRFTEHGAAARIDGNPVAAWGGVALFSWDGRQLSGCSAEEDYLSRRRQLAERRCDPIEPPAAAPWNAATADPDPAAEETVRRWLAAGELDGVDLDDGWLGHPAELRLDDRRLELRELFSAGSKVAFHGALHGRYAAGLPGVAEAAATAASTLHLAGLVTVVDGRVASGRIIRDRLGLQRSLTAPAAS